MTLLIPRNLLVRNRVQQSCQHQGRAKRCLQRLGQLGFIGDAANNETIPKTLAQQFTAVTGDHHETPGAQAAMIGGPHRRPQNCLQLCFVRSRSNESRV